MGLKALTTEHKAKLLGALEEYRAGRRARRKGEPCPPDASDGYKRGWLRLTKPEAEGVDLDGAIRALETSEQNPIKDPVGDVANALPGPEAAPAPAAPPPEMYKDAPYQPPPGPVQGPGPAMGVAQPGASPAPDPLLSGPLPEHRCGSHREADALCEVAITTPEGFGRPCGKPVYHRINRRMALVYAKHFPMIAARVALKRPDVPQPGGQLVESMADFFEELSESFPLNGRWIQLFMLGSLTWEYIGMCRNTIAIIEARAKQEPDAPSETHGGNGSSPPEVMPTPVPRSEDKDGPFWPTK